MPRAFFPAPLDLLAVRHGVRHEIQRARLAVDLQADGAAVALAEGIRRSVGSTFGVGITGIAGPGGGSEEKPVGTVHIALATPTGTKERLVHVPGDREMIRFYASQLALDMVRVHYLFDGKPQPRRVNPAS